MRRPNQILSSLMLVLALFALAACESGSSSAPFSGPDISGVWTGSWRDASAKMTLEQKGSKVEGILLIGVQEFEISGNVDKNGVFGWSGLTTRTDDCVGMSSTLDDFQVQSQGKEMLGVARRATQSGGGSEPCGSRTLVEGGTMELERAF